MLPVDQQGPKCMIEVTLAPDVDVLESLRNIQHAGNLHVQPQLSQDPAKKQQVAKEIAQGESLSTRSAACPGRSLQKLSQQGAVP